MLMSAYLDMPLGHGHTTDWCHCLSCVQVGCMSGGVKLRIYKMRDAGGPGDWSRWGRVGVSMEYGVRATTRIVLFYVI